MLKLGRRIGLVGILVVLMGINAGTWLLMDRWQARVFTDVVPVESQALDTSPGPTALPSTLSIAMHGDHGALIERPLFMRGRRPPAKEEVIAAPAKPRPEAPLPDLSDLRLTSVILTPGKEEAWFRSGTSERLVRLEAGEILREWTLHEVMPSHVVFRARDSEYRLDLRAVGGSRPDGPAADRAAPRGRI